eukprot:5217525-Pleurochrysis_carterae.AAC.1
MSRSGLLARAASTIFGKVSEAGARDLRKESGTPSGKYVAIRCEMNFSCFRIAQDSSTELSTFRRSDTGPSSSTFHLSASASTKLLHNEPAPSCE